jgi:hypothetical protein
MFAFYDVLMETGVIEVYSLSCSISFNLHLSHVEFIAIINAQSIRLVSGPDGLVNIDFTVGYPGTLHTYIAF